MNIKTRNEIQLIKEQTGITVNKLIKVEDNEEFKRLWTGSKEYFKQNVGVRIERDNYLSFVQKGNQMIAKYHKAISIVLHDDSTLRVATGPNKCLEITRVVVNPVNQSKGYGTLLMDLFLDFLRNQLGYVPQLLLECVGAINFQGEILRSSVSEQTAFFRKFGFRVSNRKHYPDYVSMIRKVEEIERLPMAA